MKILICVSGNAANFKFEYNQVFVFEQIESVRKIDPTIEYKVFPIVGKGIKGYLSSLRSLKNIIKDYRPDLIHAHCGQVGALAVLQRSIPVITTFHGSDVNSSRMRPISSFASLFSTYSFFVSDSLMKKLRIKSKKRCIIPCGVNLDVFFPRDKKECKDSLGIDRDYVLFSSAFDNSIKNPELAKAVVAHLPQLDLLEIKGRSREEVARLINGAEVLLMTSHSEGSPQIIKEAIACHQRIVTVDVGDVREQLEGIPDCIICEKDETQLVEAIKTLLRKERTHYEVTNRFDSRVIAKMILNKYQLYSKEYGKV